MESNYENYLSKSQIKNTDTQLKLTWRCDSSNCDKFILEGAFYSFQDVHYVFTNRHNIAIMRT